MPHLQKDGRAPHGDVDRYIDTRAKARLPDGTMSRSFHIITTPNRLRKKIRPIEEKKLKKHEYRNSITTPERRGICDWCDLGLYKNPLHFF